MTEPVWLSDGLPLALHERLVAEFGGLTGVRDQGLLESALARPRQLAAYGRAGIIESVAGYATGIVRNHPFVDGNKRVGFPPAGLDRQMRKLPCGGGSETLSRVMANSGAARFW